jgi:hypothetical protein
LTPEAGRVQTAAPGQAAQINANEITETATKYQSQTEPSTRTKTNTYTDSKGHITTKSIDNITHQTK